MLVNTVEAAAQWLRTHFDPQAARAVACVVQIDLSGSAGGSLHLRIEGVRLAVEIGSAAKPDLVLRLAAADYYALLAGRENAELLFMDGRMEIEGPLHLAMKMRSLFPLG
jgi:putative sterol carrier protein